MSPIPRDYRKQKDPRLFSIEILIELISQKVNEFTSREIADLFKIPIAESCTRINVLKRYGCIKVIKPETYPRVYEITDWGKRYSEKKKKEYGL